MRITISNENNVPIITKDQDRNFGSSPKRTDTNSTNSQPQTPYLLKIGQGQNISAISPLLQSDPSSPMNYNLLAELGSSNSVHRNMSVPFEEDQIFINEQFGHEVNSICEYPLNNTIT